MNTLLDLKKAFEFSIFDANIILLYTGEALYNESLYNEFSL
jgi:hypothetical protein